MARNKDTGGVVTVEVDEDVEVSAPPIQHDSNLILSLDATCWCGERMAYVKGTKVWKCLRIHTNNPIRKAKRPCEELPASAFGRILSVFQVRPTKDEDSLNEIPDQAPTTERAKLRAAQIAAETDPNSARNRAKAAQIPKDEIVAE